jgi:hypothetical protein
MKFYSSDRPVCSTGSLYLLDEDENSDNESSGRSFCRRCSFDTEQFCRESIISTSQTKRGAMSRNSSMCGHTMWSQPSNGSDYFSLADNEEGYFFGMDQRIGSDIQDYPKDIPSFVYDNGDKVDPRSSIDFDYTKIYAEQDYLAPIRAFKSRDCTSSLGTTGDNAYRLPSPTDATAEGISSAAVECGSGINTRSERGRKCNFSQSSFQLFLNPAPCMQSIKKAWIKQSATFRSTCRNRLAWRRKPKSSSSLYLFPHFHVQWDKTGRKLKAWLTAKMSLHHSCMSNQRVM